MSCFRSFKHKLLQGCARLLRWLSGKEAACQCRRYDFDPWVMRIPLCRKWQPTPVFLPGKFRGMRNLAGYSPWGHKESGMTERACIHLCRWGFGCVQTVSFTTGWVGGRMLHLVQLRRAGRGLKIIRRLFGRECNLLFWLRGNGEGMWWAARDRGCWWNRTGVFLQLLAQVQVCRAGWVCTCQ